MMAFHRMKLEAPFKIVVAYPGYLVCVIRVVTGDIRFVPFPAEMDQGHLEIKPDFGILQHRQVPFESNDFTVIVLIDIGIVQYAVSCTCKKELMKSRFEIGVDNISIVKDQYP